MSLEERREAHLVEAKNLIDNAIIDTGFGDGARGVDRLSELADNLEKVSNNKAFDIANERYANFQEELAGLELSEEETDRENELYKEQIVSYVISCIKRNL